MAAGTETKFLVAFLILVNAIVLLEIGRSTYTLPYRLSGRLEGKPARGGGQRDEDKEGKASSNGGDGGVVFRVGGNISDAQDRNQTVVGAPSGEDLGAETTDFADAAGLEEKWHNPQANAGKVVHQDEEECRRMKSSFRIVPGKDWGSADVDAQLRWSSLGCDMLLAVETGVGGGRSHRLPMDCTARPSAPTDPLIAICAGSTTRGVKNPAVEKLALFIFLLPSLKRTVDCGFNYLVVIGYDVGDVFFDSIAGREMVTDWFASEVSLPASERGIAIGLELVRVDNKINKPGPVFTETTKVAYERGANYIYRVNDDSEMTTPWAKIFVDTLEVGSGGAR